MPHRGWCRPRNKCAAGNGRAAEQMCRPFRRGRAGPGHLRAGRCTAESPGSPGQARGRRPRGTGVPRNKCAAPLASPGRPPRARNRCATEQLCRPFRRGRAGPGHDGPAGALRKAVGLRARPGGQRQRGTDAPRNKSAAAGGRGGTDAPPGRGGGSPCWARGLCYSAAPLGKYTDSWGFFGCPSKARWISPSIARPMRV